MWTVWENGLTDWVMGLLSLLVSMHYMARDTSFCDTFGHDGVRVCVCFLQSLGMMINDRRGFTK